MTHRDRESEVVDLVAKAIGHSLEYDWDHLQERSDSYPEDRQSLRRHARAAIREFSRELVRLGDDSLIAAEVREWSKR